MLLALLVCFTVPIARIAVVTAAARARVCVLGGIVPAARQSATKGIVVAPGIAVVDAIECFPTRKKCSPWLPSEAGCWAKEEVRRGVRV